MRLCSWKEILHCDRSDGNRHFSGCRNMDHIPVHIGLVLMITIHLLTSRNLTIPTWLIKKTSWTEIQRRSADGERHLAEELNTWVWVQNRKRVERRASG